MVQVVHGAGERFELTQTHMSIGLAVLLLALVRLCLRIRATAPVPAPAAPLVMNAAKAVHIALYVLLLAMPLSGWLMASTTPVRVPTCVFGLFDLPYPLAPGFATYRTPIAKRQISNHRVAKFLSTGLLVLLQYPS